MNKITGGPWRACHNGDCVCRMIWSVPHDVPVAVALGAHDEHYTAGDGVTSPAMLGANARAIAAVPAMLELLGDCADSGALPNKLETRVREFIAGVLE